MFLLRRRTWLGCALAILTVCAAATIGTARAANNAVTIHDDSLSPSSFAPNPITVQQGDTVTWTNTGPATHTVTSDTGAFGSGNLSVGQTFTHMFTAAGTYTYHCSIHPTMTGTVIVQAAAGATGTPAAAATQGAATAPSANMPAAPAPTTSALPSSASNTAAAPAPTTTGALPSTGSGPARGAGAGIWSIVALAVGALGVAAVGAPLFVRRRH